MCSRPHDPDCPGYDPGPGDPLDPAYLRQRIREEPGDWRRWYRLGDRLLDLCREENRALEALDHASCLNPRQIGVCLHAMGRGREALVALEEAVRLKPNHLPALRRLYLVASELGETDTARRHLEALFGFNPVRARELMEGYRERPGTPAWTRRAG